MKETITFNGKPISNEYQPPHDALPQGTKDAIDRLANEAVEQMRRTTGYFGDIVSDEQAEDEVAN